MSERGRFFNQAMSRRKALKLGGGIVAAGAVGYGGYTGLRDGYLAAERVHGRHEIRGVFEDIMKNSHKFIVYNGLLEIDPSAQTSDLLLADAKTNKSWKDEDGVLYALRPIAVHGTLLRNIADYPQGTQDSVDRVLNEVHPRLMAFYDPDQSQRLIYLDADANAGLVLPLDANAQSTASFESLPVENLNIDGRQIRGNQLYPYIEDLYVNYQTKKAEDDIYLIGQSFWSSEGRDALLFAQDFLNGEEPISIPKP